MFFFCSTEPGFILKLPPTKNWRGIVVDDSRKSRWCYLRFDQSLNQFGDCSRALPGEVEWVIPVRSGRSNELAFTQTQSLHESDSRFPR